MKFLKQMIFFANMGMLKEFIFMEAPMANITLLEKALPIAPLKIAALDSCKELGQKVNDYIVSFRQNAVEKWPDSASIANYRLENYLVDSACPRFGSGEAKGMLRESIRGTDLFIMVDVCNYSLTSL